MTNRLANYKDDDILYVLTIEDIIMVGRGWDEDDEEDGGMGIKDIEERVKDPAFVSTVVRGLESGLGSCWTDIMETAITMAMEDTA